MTTYSSVLMVRLLIVEGSPIRVKNPLRRVAAIATTNTDLHNMIEWPPRLVQQSTPIFLQEVLINLWKNWKKRFMSSNTEWTPLICGTQKRWEFGWGKASFYENLLQNWSTFYTDRNNNNPYKKRATYYHIVEKLRWMFFRDVMYSGTYAFVDFWSRRYHLWR